MPSRVASRSWASHALVHYFRPSNRSYDATLAFASSPAVLVTRNPYRRLLSAYLDKVFHRKMNERRQLFHGMPEWNGYSFPTFDAFVHEIGASHARRGNITRLNAHLWPMIESCPLLTFRYPRVISIEDGHVVDRILDSLELNLTSSQREWVKKNCSANQSSLGTQLLRCIHPTTNITSAHKSCAGVRGWRKVYPSLETVKSRNWKEWYSADLIAIVKRVYANDFRGLAHNGVDVEEPI
jgi:hypothetical protein